MGAGNALVVDTSIVIAVIGFLAAPIAAITTYVTTRPKQKSDVHTNVVNSAGAAVEAIADVLGEVRQELEEARVEIEALRHENETLRSMVTDLRREIKELHDLKSGPEGTPF